MSSSAPQIPNLNTLRRGRGGPRSRGRGLGRGSAGPDSDVAEPLAAPAPSGQRALSKDAVIQKTDTDASTSRLSAVETGYLDDPFARLLTEDGGGSGVARRLPLMNRGTYVRTTSIDMLVDSFIGSKPSQRKQIISLGAGSDTRFFRLRRRYGLKLNLLYHEIDFTENTGAKIRCLRRTETRQVLAKEAGWDSETANLERNEGEGETALHSEDYHIHPLDLRALPGGSLYRPQSVTTSDSTTNDNTHPFTIHPSISPSLPTLLLSECCLIYLTPSDATAVLSYFTQNLFSQSQSSSSTSSSLGIIIYEPIRPHDPFGRTMVSNLIARGIQLGTLEKWSSLGAQRRRLRDCGFGSAMQHTANADDHISAGVIAGVGAADLDFIYRNWIPAEEKERVEGLEWMDELEEWRLLMTHYALVWGWCEAEAGSKDEQEGKNGCFEEWKTSFKEQEGEA